MMGFEDWVDFFIRISYIKSKRKLGESQVTTFVSLYHPVGPGIRPKDRPRRCFLKVLI